MRTDQCAQQRLPALRLGHGANNDGDDGRHGNDSFSRVGAEGRQRALAGGGALGRAPTALPLCPRWWCTGPHGQAHTASSIPALTVARTGANQQLCAGTTLGFYFLSVALQFRRILNRQELWRHVLFQGSGPGKIRHNVQVQLSSHLLTKLR